MEKKLTAQGPRERKSYTVTLPLDWVKKEGLNKTKKVELEIVGNRVVISPEKEIQERVVVEGGVYQNSMLKVLQGLYRLGVDEIRINYREERILGEILDIINTKLIGYEIVEQEKNHLIIKDITKEASEEFNTLLRRVFLLLLSIVETKEAGQAENLSKNIKKLINYCQRILVKKGHSDYVKVPFYYVLLEQLEKISDEYTWILGLKPKKGSALFQEINHSLRKLYELYYRFNPEEYNKYEYLTYRIKNQIKNKPGLTLFDMHLHNLARQLNTLYGVLFVLRFQENKA